MPVLVQDRELAAQLLREREAAGDHTRDEVWDGVTVIMPEADIEHDDIAGYFYRTFWAVFGEATPHRIHFRVNVSDRVEDWKLNYRVPDASVYLSRNPAQMCGTHYVGGPDVALEVVSPDDRSRDKLGFYTAVGTREVVIVDRDPWRLELYQLRRGRMRLKGAITPGDGGTLASGVLPLKFQLIRSRPRPKVKIVHAETGREWVF
ncbi:MAG TPA: Uma2 family endonuclease [Gemmataceae bacterium]|nr:Uma2 family endonuclease [Gemmataceae bacterium]